VPADSGRFRPQIRGFPVFLPGYADLAIFCTSGLKEFRVFLSIFFETFFIFAHYALGSTIPPR
jgi:hypothetical protein